jgi:hypothetical protein
MKLPTRIAALSTAVLLTWGTCTPEFATAQDAPFPPRAFSTAETTGEQTQTDPLFTRVDEAIEISSRRYLIAGTHTPWQIMHGVLALRQDFKIKVGEEKVTALDWIRDSATHKGEPWFEVTRYGGRAHPFSKPYIFEGHPGQFLAIMTMSDLPLDYTIQTSTGPITMQDVVKNLQMEVNSNEEITWLLWGLSHYLSPDARWLNKYNEPWSIERLVRMQTEASVRDAACGGTHGLYALTYARNKYLRSGQRLAGDWIAADQKIQQYIAYARSLQNPDGSFSASYFEGRKQSSDFNERLATTGHTLEWIVQALPDRRLNEPWFRSAVNLVASEMIENRSQPADCGPLYHALHALVLYRERTRPEPPAKPEQDETADAAQPAGSDPAVAEKPDVTAGE